MSMSFLDRQRLIEKSLAQHKVDLRSQVHFSHDDVIANGVMPDLDISHHDPIAGITRRLSPITLMSDNETSVIQTVDPNTEVEWHCHVGEDIYHWVISGHVLVSRIKRDATGAAVKDANGNFVREERRVGPLEWWYAPDGHPYSFRTEAEPCVKIYFHIQRSGSRTRGCIDPTATVKT